MRRRKKFLVEVRERCHENSSKIKEKMSDVKGRTDKEKEKGKINKRKEREG